MFNFNFNFARRMVSQNKRRYQSSGFDLDLTYITDNIIAMGFPAGDWSSGMWGMVEGMYRNHMTEVLRFLDQHHEGHYKIYNLCLERIYDPSKFHGVVATFPFQDHNCPPVRLISAFCESATQWLAGSKDRVVVVHCKAGKGRTGLMICCLLLHMGIFKTREEAVTHFNAVRTSDGKGLNLPSQLRYVRYYESMLQQMELQRAGGVLPEGCHGPRVLQALLLHNCPPCLHLGVALSTPDHLVLASRGVWYPAGPPSASGSTREGALQCYLPPGLALQHDFKVEFREKGGNFFFWANTAFCGDRLVLQSRDLDHYARRRRHDPALEVELVFSPPPDTARATDGSPRAAPPSVAWMAPPADLHVAAKAHRLSDHGLPCGGPFVPSVPGQRFMYTHGAVQEPPPSSNGDGPGAIQLSHPYAPPSQRPQQIDSLGFPGPSPSVSAASPPRPHTSPDSSDGTGSSGWARRASMDAEPSTRDPALSMPGSCIRPARATEGTSPPDAPSARGHRSTHPLPGPSWQPPKTFFLLNPDFQPSRTPSCSSDGTTTPLASTSHEDLLASQHCHSATHLQAIPPPPPSSTDPSPAPPAVPEAPVSHARGAPGPDAAAAGGGSSSVSTATPPAGPRDAATTLRAACSVAPSTSSRPVPVAVYSASPGKPGAAEDVPVAACRLQGSPSSPPPDHELPRASSVKQKLTHLNSGRNPRRGGGGDAEAEAETAQRSHNEV